MKLRLLKVLETAADRPSGYFEEVVSKGEVDGEFLEIAPEALEFLRKKYRPEPPLPPLPAQAANYVAAQARDLIAGQPRRSREECEEIVRLHCEPCEHFRPSDRRCAMCGCPVAEKIPMERERCPDGRW